MDIQLNASFRLRSSYDRPRFCSIYVDQNKAKCLLIGQELQNLQLDNMIIAACTNMWEHK